MLKAGIRSFTFPEEALREVRRDIYHSSGPGYHLIRGFLDPPQAEHVRRFWTEQPSTIRGDFEPWRGRPHFVVGDGPFATHLEGKSVWIFALWNRPADDVTHAAAVAVTQLRNQIEQQSIFRDLLPCGPMMTFYKVVVSRESEEIEVKWHRDRFSGKSQKTEVETRLQATLFLAEHGVDYRGDGMIFEDNHGREIRVGESLGIKPGDLLVWRYYNRHCVGSVIPVPGGVGFARIVYPLLAIKTERQLADRAVEISVVTPTMRQRMGRVARRVGLYDSLKKMGL